MDRKKIVIFSLAYFPKPVGGAEIAVKEITSRIEDIEFHIVTHRFDPSLPREEQLGNVFVHRIGDGTSYFAKMLFVLRAAFAGMKLQRIHTFDAAWAMMSYMSIPLMFMRFLGVRLPYALSLQEGDPFEHVFDRWHIRLVRPLLRVGFRSAIVIQTISTFLARWADIVGSSAAVVIPNGVDTKHFAQSYPAAAVDEMKDALDKKMGDVFLITTSRLVHKNAVDDVVMALTKLPENVRFIVLGTGPEEASLKRLAAKLRVEHRVQFVGHVSHERMPKYLKACDIFVRPSRSEGMGNSFIEAMAASLPVIATQEGGISDFLFDEKRNPDKPITGWAVDKDSPDGIVAAVKAIMGNPEKVRAVTATAKQMVIEKYDWDVVAKDMREKVFERALGMSPVAH